MYFIMFFCVCTVLESAKVKNQQTRLRVHTASNAAINELTEYSKKLREERRRVFIKEEIVTEEKPAPKEALKSWNRVNSAERGGRRSNPSINAPISSTLNEMLSASSSIEETKGRTGSSRGKDAHQ